MNGQRNGKGTMTWPLGLLYFEGIFKEDKREGLGTLKSKHGDTYHGMWSDDVRSGLGKMVWADGTQYTGEWDNDKRQG